MSKLATGGEVFYFFQVSADRWWHGERSEKFSPNDGLKKKNHKDTLYKCSIIPKHCFFFLSFYLKFPIIKRVGRKKKEAKKERETVWVCKAAQKCVRIIFSL